MNKFSYFYLFGRKDRGIENPADLKGKKIGVTRGSIAEFYLILNEAPPARKEIK